MELLQADLNTLNRTLPESAKAGRVSSAWRWVGWLLSCLLCLALGAGGGFYAALKFFVATPVAEVTETVVKTAESGSMQQAMALMQTARDRFSSVRDYRCLYLRDEMIDNQFNMNVMNLKVRHEPFSVCMEWLGPAQKRGRKAAYVHGKNDNKMMVKQLITLKMDPSESIKKKESRHQITEAGIQNLINRYTAAWERENKLGKTTITIEEKIETVNLGERSFTHNCQVVTAKKPADSQDLFEFFYTKVYFDKELGLPIRLECYEFPTPAHPEGRLVERYTYLDLKLNAGLTDADFSVR